MEPRVGVEQAQLPRDGRLDGRVRVPEHRDVVDHVDVAAAVGVDEVVAPAALDPGRLVEVVLLGRREDRVAAVDQRGGVVARRGRGAGQAQQRRRVRAQLEPGRGERRDGRAAARRDAASATALDVDVRREPVRCRWRTDADDVARRDLGPLPDRRVDAVEDDVEDAADDEAVRRTRTRPPTGAWTGVPASANTSTPRWTVAASSIASRVVSTRRPSPQRPTGRAPPATAPRTRSPTAVGSPICGPSRATDVVDRSSAATSPISASSGAVASLTIARSTGPCPAASRSTASASANGTSTTASSAAHSSSRVATTYALSGSSEACWSPLIATDAARATTSGHSAAISAAVSGTSAA